MGKAAVASTMMLYAFETARLASPVGLASVWEWAERLVGAIVFTSIFDKISAFVTNLRAAQKTPHAPPETVGAAEDKE
jgi:hypothetical protein